VTALTRSDAACLTGKHALKGVPGEWRLYAVRN
jgi:hypothetical protein